MSRETRIDCFKKHLARAISMKGSGGALSGALGCTAQTISNWKNRGIDRPTQHSLPYLKRLADLLNLSSPDDLFEFSDTDSKVATDSVVSPVHQEIIRRFKEILDSPEGSAFLYDLFNDPIVGTSLVRRILDFPISMKKSGSD
jgi:hypothetical protein